MRAIVWSLLWVTLAAAEEVVRFQLSTEPPALRNQPAEAAEDGGSAGATRYHERVGVPLAAALRRAEAKADGGEASVRIVGGLPSYVGEHPFFAGLVITLSSGQTSVCGSALVTSYRLVTAAQCWWDGRAQAYAITAVLGSVRLFSGGQRYSASTVIAHGGYDPATLANDIAVLVVPYVTTNSAVSPIALPVGAELADSFAGLSAVAIGYGKTADWASITTSAALRDVYLTVMTNAACAQVYGGAVSGGVLCTSGAGARGPCGGDGGGPLTLRYSGRRILIGVVSFVSASGCARGDPAGHTRITAYADWVRDQL